MRLFPFIPGTVALWQFQGNLSDSSGNNLNLVSVNNATDLPVAQPPFTPVADRTGGVVTNDPCLIGVDLDAAGGFTKLLAPASPLLRLTGAKTISWIMMWKFTFVWIQLSVSSTTNYMFDLRASSFGGGTPAVYNPTDGEQEFPGTTNANWAQAGLPNAGDYHPFVFTYTEDASGHWTAYKDGVAFGAGFNSTPYGSNGTERLYLGGFAGQPGGQGCAGHYTSARILNFAQSAADVAADVAYVKSPCLVPQLIPPFVINGGSVFGTWVGVTTGVARAAAPTDGEAGTQPDFQMSPFTVSKLPTTGFTFMFAPDGTAVAGAGGFAVTPWVRDPVSFTWSAMATSMVDRKQLFETNDIDASELYFQIGNVAADGTLHMRMLEQ